MFLFEWMGIRLCQFLSLSLEFLFHRSTCKIVCSNKEHCLACFLCIISNSCLYMLWPHFLFYGCIIRLFGFLVIYLSSFFTAKFIAGTNNPDDAVTEHNLYNCSDQLFEIQIGDSKELCERISIEKGDMVCKILGFEKRYNEFVRPLLVSRCSIVPKDKDLSHHSTVFLHR